MIPAHHLADAASLQRGLRMGRVFQPRAQWDPRAGTWIVMALPRQGGGPWVLSQGPEPAAFVDLDRAWEAADGLRELGSLLIRGRR